MIEGHRFAPIGHSASGILLRDLRKSLLSLLILEIMEERQRRVESFLRVRRAGNSKIHSAKLLDLRRLPASIGARSLRCTRIHFRRVNSCNSGLWHEETARCK